MAAAEIGLDHRVVAHHGFRRAAGDDVALVEHQHALGQRHDHFHDVLDDDDGDAHVRECARTSAIAACNSVGGQAGERLVEQHQPRLGREHAGDLETLAAGRAERARRAGRRPARPVNSTMPPRVLARVVAMRMPQERADHDVLEHAHVLEGGRHLEGAADAERAHALPARHASRPCRRRRCGRWSA